VALYKKSIAGSAIGMGTGVSLVSIGFGSFARDGFGNIFGVVMASSGGITIALSALLAPNKYWFKSKTWGQIPLTKKELKIRTGVGVLLVGSGVATATLGFVGAVEQGGDSYSPLGPLAYGLGCVGVGTVVIGAMFLPRPYEARGSRTASYLKSRGAHSIRVSPGPVTVLSGKF
jgi:hypothetical protein